MHSRLKYVVISLILLSQQVLANTSATRIMVKSGFGRGGLAFGGEYILPETTEEALTLYLSIHSKKESESVAGLKTVGAAARISHQLGAYEVFISPGFGVIDYDLGDEEELLLGPKLSYGFQAELNAGMYLGLEVEKLYSWIGEKTGLMSDVMMATLTIDFGV